MSPVAPLLNRIPLVRSAVLVVAMVAAVAVASSASGSRNDSVAIRPGVGIGPINLGMTGQQVRRVLGRPSAVMTRRVIGGRPYVKFQWGLGDWNVGLLGRKGNRRVVLVGTALGRHRTPEGLGVGTRESRLWRELRGRIRERDCDQYLMGAVTDLEWFVRAANAETVFFPEAARSCHLPGTCVGADYLYVGQVEVRASPLIGCAL
jgi:hypothetical protein